MDKKAKNILILGAILAIITIAIVIYFSFIKTLPTTEENNGGKKNGFSPFPISSVNGGKRPVSTSTIPIDDPIQANLPRLRLISADPVAGTIATTSASSTIIRYVERGRGHVYETKTDGASVVKILNKTIPDLYEAIWSPDGMTYFIKYLENKNTIADRVISLTKNTSSSTSDESPFLSKMINIENNSDTVIASPDLKDPSFVYSIVSDEGITVYKKNIKTNKTETLLKDPYKYWNITWPEKNTLILTTKASAYGSGSSYLYTIGSNSGLKLIQKGVSLETLPNKNYTKIAFSSINNGTYEVKIYDVKTSKITDTPIRTMAEKCTWGSRDQNVLYCGIPVEFKSGIYPEEWFKGLISLDDRLWSYDTKDDSVKELGNPTALAGVTIDVINIFTDPKEQYLIFQNKNDLSLWSLEIK